MAQRERRLATISCVEASVRFDGSTCIAVSAWVGVAVLAVRRAPAQDSVRGTAVDQGSGRMCDVPAGVSDGNCGRESISELQSGLAPRDVLGAQQGSVMPGQGNRQALRDRLNDVADVHEGAVFPERHPFRCGIVGPLLGDP